MDRVHEGVHRLGPQGWSMDQGSVFCIRSPATMQDYFGHNNLQDFLF